jgi:hypothetical protein
VTERSDGYTEEEAALILRRAAELAPAQTMSLAELEAVADEAGLDKALIRRAAVELRERGRDPLPLDEAGVFGPTRTVYERIAAGAIDAQAWSRIVAEIRRHVDEPGHLEEIGDELIWRSRARGQSSGRDIRITVTPRQGKTLVRVEEKTSVLAGGLYGGLIGGLAGAGLGWILPVAIAVLGLPILIPVLLAGWVWASYLLARTIYRGTLANRRPQLEALAEGVVRLCGEIAAHEGPPIGSKALPTSAPADASP